MKPKRHTLLARSFPTLFFFFTVWAGAFFFISLYNVIFIIAKVAFPKLWPEISMIEIGRGVLAELTTVSNWGRLGRDRSRSHVTIAITKVVITIFGSIIAIFAFIIIAIILAELTTVSNWGRLGRDRSRSLFIIIAIF